MECRGRAVCYPKAVVNYCVFSLTLLAALPLWAHCTSSSFKSLCPHRPTQLPTLFCRPLPYKYGNNLYIWRHSFATLNIQSHKYTISIFWLVYTHEIVNLPENIWNFIEKQRVSFFSCMKNFIYIYYHALRFCFSIARN